MYKSLVTRPLRAEPRFLRAFSAAPLAARAPGRPSRPPAKMVEEAPPPPRGLRGLIRKIFDSSKPRAGLFSDSARKPLSLEPAPKQKAKFLRTDKTTNLLYWYCTDLVFSQADFERVGPPNAKFQVTRARDPVNMKSWMGYFLEFETPEAALAYFEHTLGHELCGLPLKLRFTMPDIQGFHSPILEKTNLPRRAHVLMLGLPHGISEHAILRAAWDFDLVDDDSLAVEKMPMGRVLYGGNPVLLRFRTEAEAARFVREFDSEIFPHTNSKVLCEVVD